MQVVVFFMMIYLEEIKDLILTVEYYITQVSTSCFSPFIRRYMETNDCLRKEKHT